MKNKETLEEASIINCESITHPYCDREKAMFIKGTKWQAERSYNEEDMIEFSKFCQTDEFESRVVNKSLLELFKKFKKPNIWYNEEQTNKRMNVIGQNGNDGTHYEKN